LGRGILGLFFKLQFGWKNHMPQNAMFFFSFLNCDAVVMPCRVVMMMMM
jgi:hypothetical protein